MLRPIFAMRGVPLLVLCGALCVSIAAEAGQVLRREIEPGVYALLRDDRVLGLEVRAPAGSDSRRILTKYLAIESEWSAYRDRLNVFVPYSRLKYQQKREVLLALFDNDVINTDGWWHIAVFEHESVADISEWITGKPTNYRAILADPQNAGRGMTIRAGERILVPVDLVPAAMRKHTPRQLVEPKPELEAMPAGDLEYGRDGKGDFAAYRLKRGETLYSHVVARFTDLREAADILTACDLIAARSGIRDVRDIDAGARIVVPAELLSAKYLPRGTTERESYEATLLEADRLRGIQGQSRDLEGVVVILDPGHGGKDHGAESPKHGLYEDEINYDIAVRIARILRRESAATVHLTVYDRRTGEEPQNVRRFINNADEELRTNPPHRDLDGGTISVSLRWMLANSIFDREVRRGIDPNKVVYSSIHTDSMHPGLRGAMVYIPGAHRRRPQESRTGNVYEKYSEGRAFSRFASTESERRRDEALSRNFAEVLIDELGRHQIKRHDKGDPIRSEIRRTATQVYVPAVIRNNNIPTKVLVETANIQNATDRERLADPEWRELFARAYVSALRRHFNAETPARLAQTD